MENNRDVQVGEVAPDFTLEDEDGSPVTLSALRGETIVLMFYPFDWSGYCTDEHCAMRDAEPDWAGTGARIYGISRDSTYSHKAWKAHLGLAYPLLADMRGEVAKLYGAWNEGEYRADRMTVVVDPEGIVRYVRHNHAGLKRDPYEALDAIRGLVPSMRG